MGLDVKDKKVHVVAALGRFACKEVVSLLRGSGGARDLSSAVAGVNAARAASCVRSCSSAAR
jgi:hypothetical protein